jgi:hypothetical protein
MGSAADQGSEKPQETAAPVPVRFKHVLDGPRLYGDQFGEIWCLPEGRYPPEGVTEWSLRWRWDGDPTRLVDHGPVSELQRRFLPHGAAQPDVDH